MRTKSNPLIIGVVYAAYVFIITLVIVLAACAHVPPIPAGIVSPAVYSASTVRVETECGWGSGVLIDEDRVVTAHHVIDCDNRDHKIRLAKHVVIATVDGQRSVASFEALDEERDLARLRLATPVLGARTLTVAHATKGGVVCAVTAIPVRTIKCGVYSYKNNTYEGGLGLTHINLWFGNSGSPVYDSSGVLVGIITRLRWCSFVDNMIYDMTGANTGSCGGYATPVEGPAAP